MVEFVELTSVDSPEYNQAIEIYEEAFPLAERQPVSVIRHRISSGLYQAYVGRLEETGEVVSLAFLWPFKDSNFILLDYLAVKKSIRGQNVGSAYLASMIQVLNPQQKYLLIEVDNPKFAPDESEATRRIAFYQRNGAQLMKDLRYLLPPAQGNEPTEMMLMIFPNYKTPQIEASQVRDLIIQLYREAWERGMDDPYLNEFINDVADPIELV